MECRGISLTHMDMTNLFLYLLLRRSVFSSNLLKRSELKIYLAFIVFLTPKTDVKHNLTLNAGLPLASRCIYTYIKDKVSLMNRQETTWRVIMKSMLCYKKITVS
ncbi:Uncharacterized protein Rs2_38670 [Raphanus sativus]|nr:Uncharacterized protein Rs2_38670 [Raphanus sativus]